MGQAFPFLHQMKKGFYEVHVGDEVYVVQADSDFDAARKVKQQTGSMPSHESHVIGPMESVVNKLAQNPLIH